jgi:hypothetical protein
MFVCRLKRKPTNTYVRMNKIIPSSGLNKAIIAVWAQVHALKFVTRE